METAKIINQMLQNQSRFVHEQLKNQVVVSEKETELKCQCGGNLSERHTMHIPKGLPPRHRKKRLRKKLQRKWEEKHAGVIFMNAAVSLIQKPSYSCTQCGKVQGFYQTMARNMFTVEPLPECAIPFYLNDVMEKRMKD